MQFRDSWIAEEVARACVVSCKRPSGRHDGCFVVVKDDEAAVVVRTRDGAFYRLTVETLLNQRWVQPHRLGRRERVELGLAEAPSARRLTPTQVRVATALRVAGINSPAALRAYAAERGISPRDVLRQVAGRAIADRALADFER